MEIKYQPIKKSRLSDHVTNALLEMIKDKQLLPGNKLPSERELAEQFEVSRVSVREALKIMENIGYLESKVGVGGGTFVKEITLDTIIDPFTEFLESEENMVIEMLDFRLIIETEFARIAANLRSEEDLAAIDLAVRAMRSEIRNGGIGLTGDNAFHEAVVKATHNNVFEKVLLMAKSILTKTRETTLRIANQPEMSIEDHEKIYRAIIEKDGEKAAELMQSHLMKAKRNALYSLKKQNPEG